MEWWKTGTKTGIGTGADVGLSRRRSVHSKSDAEQWPGSDCRALLQVLAMLHRSADPCHCCPGQCNLLHSTGTLLYLICLGQPCPWIIYHSALEMDSCFFPSWLLYKDVKHQGRVLCLQESGSIALPLYFGAGWWDGHAVLLSLCQLCFYIQWASFCSAPFCQPNNSELPMQIQSLSGLMLHWFGGFLETVGLSWYYTDFVILFPIHITCQHITHI